MAGRVTSPAFIARDAELSALAEAAGRATDGAASIVVVGGEAGVGKTRLVTEFGARARDTGAIVLQGACISLGGDEALPFAPIAQALRGLLRDHGPMVTDLLDASTSELGSIVPELGRTDEEPGPGRPDWAQTRLFESLLTLLGRLGERAPTILILEDLHWADRTTRDVISFLTGSLVAERVLIVATFRSDELHRRHPLRPWLAEMERDARVIRLELDRLRPSDVRAQLEAILGHPPTSGLVEAIVRRAAGNPFFTEELLAAGATESDDHLPASLREVLLVRVRTLSELGQEVIGCAAIAGASFDDELLSLACGIPETSVSAALREAIAAQLVVVADGARSFTFRHALLQEAVYDDLLPGDRRRGHARYAQVLASRPVPDGAEGASHLAALAHHATAAHDLTAALTGWIDAARASARVYALAEASDAYERSLDLWDVVPPDDRPVGLDIVQLMYEASLTLIGSGRLNRARNVAEEAVLRFDPASDPLRAAILRERFARALWLVGDLAAALATLEEAVELCREQPSTPEHARVVASLAGLLVLKDHNERAVAIGRQALALARAAGARNVESYALCGLGMAMVNRGDCETGLPMIREAARLAEDLQLSSIDLHRTYANLSTGLQMCGRLEEAVAVSLEGVEWARARGLWRLQGAFLEANAAAALVELGRWDEAQAILDQRERPITEGVTVLNNAVVAGPLAVRTGRLEDARVILGNARHGVAGLLDAQFTGPIYGGLVELALQDGRSDEALAIADEAIDRLAGSEDVGRRHRVELNELALRADVLAIAMARAHRDSASEADRIGDAEARITAIRGAFGDDMGLPDGMGGEVRGFAAMAEAEYLVALDRPDPAAWATAAGIWERLGRPWHVARCRLAEAEAILATRRSRVEATPPLRVAHELARRLGAVPLIAACESLARFARIDLDRGGALGDLDGSASGDAASAGPARFDLTDRELEVLALLADGYSNRRIGETLFISESTAGVHVSNILGKLGASNRVEAAAIALRTGLTE